MELNSIAIISITVSAAVWALGLFANRMLGYAELSPSSWNYRVDMRLRVARRVAFGLGIWFLLLSFSPLSINVETDSWETKNVEFVLDVSRSMDVVDPNESESRLERAKTFIMGMVRKYPQNSYSLSVFSSEASVAIPRTADAEAFGALLSGISSKYSTAVGTDFLILWKELDDRYRPHGSGATDGNPSTLAVILTDGGDQEDTPSAPSLRSVFQHVGPTLKILTVTLGSSEWGPVPLGRDFMGGVVLQTDSSGNAVVSKANPETAKRIAEVTDGYESSEKEAEKRFRKALESVSSSGQENAGNTVPVSPFHFLSFISFVAAFVIPDKMRSWYKKPSSSVR